MAVSAWATSSPASFCSHTHLSGAVGQQQGATNTPVGSVSSRIVFRQSVRAPPLFSPSVARKNSTTLSLVSGATSPSSQDSVRQFCIEKVGARQGLQVIAGRVGRRQSSVRAPVVVVCARRASSSSSDKQREEKRSVEYIPSSPPPPSTATNSVGVQEGEAIEKTAVSEAPVEELQNFEEKAEEASSGSAESAESVDEIGKAISELRRGRAAAGLQDSAGTTDFWRGVAEETKLIDWPDFSKVLGTTGVVVAMILGSSVVLLTVNAILAATSHFVFNDPAIKDIFKPT